MTKFASDLEDFRDLVESTARFKNLPDTIVEKDYYVVRALRVLSDEIADQFIFKGGTSLSKGWNLLERFSEDIDLLFRMEDKDGTKISRGEVDRRLASAEQIVATTPGFTFVRQTRSRGVRRCSDFEYPRKAAANFPLSTTVRLEMGTRGGVQPSSVRRIHSYLAEFAAANSVADLADDLSSFDVECLDLTRTCVEKLFAVHAAFEKARAKGRMRHYYDLYKLTGLEVVRRFLVSEDYAHVYKDVEKYSRENWPESSLPPDGRFSQSRAFNPTREDLAMLKQHYENEHPLFFVNPPAIEDVLARLREVVAAI